MGLALEVAKYWKQDVHSDIDVVLEIHSGIDQDTTADQPTETDNDVMGPSPAAASGNICILQRVPAHKIVLNSSPYFEAQILRWPGPIAASSTDLNDTVEGSFSSSSGGGGGGSTNQPVNQKPVLPLVLQHPSQEPAAMAVLAALYGVKPIKDLLSELSGEQQLQAALLADMWQLPAVSTAAVQLLVDAAKGRGLSEAVTQAFITLEAIPNFLLPLFIPAVSSGMGGGKPAATLKPLLLRVFGDLEGVWADAALQDILLKLPLPAMELLLGCNELQVASEDTVLYTAHKYVEAVPLSLRKPAKQQLAPLIRCPHLSSFWLSALAVSVDAPKLLLSEQQPLMKQLLMLQQADPTSEPTAAAAAELHKLLPGAPSSWLLPKRVSRQVSSVQLTWMLDVEAIRAAARQSASQQCFIDLCSDYVAPPLGGVVFVTTLRARWEVAQRASEIGLLVKPQNVPQDAFFKFVYYQCWGSDMAPGLPVVHQPEAV